MIARWLARYLGLERARHAVQGEQLWVPLSDGVRLATHIFHPVDPTPASVPTLLLRTPYGAQAFPPLLALIARLLAERGHRVVLQDVRGRYASEGRFVPFENEGRDGADAIAWTAGQSWFDGRLGLVGMSYLGYAAWAALARSPVPVGALVAGLCTRDLYSAFYTGGAFGLATGLEWGVGVGESHTVPARRLDLARGLRHRPVEEADRVTLRRTPWFRTWLAHPTRDDYWRALCLPVPGPPPPALLLAGWYDFFLEPQLRDYAALREAAGGDPRHAPRLVIGPWRHGGVRPCEGGRRNGMGRVMMREMLAFLGRTLGGDAAAGAGAGARVYALGGGGWTESEAWPPPGAVERTLHLRAGTPSAGGALGDAPAGLGEPAGWLVSDPADPTPSLGSPRLHSGGPVDQRGVEARSDVVCYSTAPLESPLEVCGPVRLVLHATCDAPDTDFVARLVDVDRAGVPRLRCEGILRARWRAGDGKERWLEPGVPTELAIDLGSTHCRFATGHRLRIELCPSLFPRYDRNGNVEAAPASVDPESARTARQHILHDAEHPSRLVVGVLEAPERI